jgi:hypothetical protein
MSIRAEAQSAQRESDWEPLDVSRALAEVAAWRPRGMVLCDGFAAHSDIASDVGSTRLIAEGQRVEWSWQLESCRAACTG